MIPLMKSVLKGFISFSYTEELCAIYGDVMTQNWAISSLRIMCNASIESSHQGLHFFLYTHEIWAIYEDVMTKKAQQMI